MGAPEMIDQVFRLREKDRTGLGKFDPPRATNEQRNAKFVFQILDLTAERRLNHVQTDGCAAKASGSRNLNEVAQLANVHVEVPMSSEAL